MAEQQATNLSSEFTDKRDELTEFLRSRLIECGWRDQVAGMCRNLIQKQGVEQIKLAEIISEVRSEALRRVPDQVKTEMLTKIRSLNNKENSME